MSPSQGRGKKQGSARPKGQPGRRRPGASPAVRKALRRGPISYPPRFVLGRINYVLMAGAGVAIIAGFILLAAEEISLSPILLVLGYCILIPASLLIEKVPRKKVVAKPEQTVGGE